MNTFSRQVTKLGISYRASYNFIMKADVIVIKLDYIYACYTWLFFYILLSSYHIDIISVVYHADIITNHNWYHIILIPYSSDISDTIFFLLYINDIYRAVGCNAVRLFADDTSLLSSDRNLHDAINQAKELFHKLYDWCLANKLSINSDKQILFYSIWKTNQCQKIWAIFKQSTRR